MRKSLLRALYCWGIGLFLFTLHAEEDSSLPQDDAMQVNSGEANYNGKEIILTGQVSVQHSLGQITAKCLSLQPSLENEKGKSKFSFIKISEDVQLKLPEGGELHCQQAEIDYNKMQGVFLGNEKSPDVLYFNDGKQNGSSFHSSPPFEVKSHEVIFDLDRDPASSKIVVRQIQAKHNIRVKYNQDYLLTADRAVYQHLKTDGNVSGGLLTLSMERDSTSCQMNSVNGDHIVAKSINIKTIDRQLILEHPFGSLLMPQEKNRTQMLRFKAQELFWDDQKQNLRLKGNVDITQNENLRIQTDEELSIARTLINGKQELRFIYAPKNTRISYLDPVKNTTHQIDCPGKLMIDHEGHTITLSGSLALPWNKVKDSQQVYMEDVLGEMSADNVEIKYAWHEKEFIPEKIVLMGHVRLLNRFDGHRDESGSILHYGLADTVEYFPANHEMILAGTENHRVLFYDKVNNMQMSAPSLKIKHDVKLRKNSIQGQGDVRFTFIEKEFEQIKQHFKFTDSTQNSG